MLGPTTIVSPIFILSGNNHPPHGNRISARRSRDYPMFSVPLLLRPPNLPADIQAIGWKAQVRLCQRFRRLSAAGKPQPKVNTAIARELVGYAWDIARRVPVAAMA